MKVAVLMSTYQGERFVEEQVRSILHQLPAGGVVLVRDDGSTDRTVERIQALGDPRVTVTRGPNVGFVRSFFSLMAAAPAHAEVLMLSDQDDVWLPGKIGRAVRHLAGRDDQATLYCSRLTLADENLRPIGASPLWPRPPSFRNALSENIVTGCTVALNRAALELVLDHGDPELIHFHDWWMYLVVSAFGEVIVDPQPTILYRQHGRNSIGMGDGWRRYWVIFQFLRKTNWVHIMFAQIANFRSVHARRMAPEQLKFLGRFFDPRNARSVARLILVPQRLRQSLVGDVLLRLLLVGVLVARRGLLAPPKDAARPAPLAGQVRGAGNAPPDDRTGSSG